MKALVRTFWGDKEYHVSPVPAESEQSNLEYVRLIRLDVGGLVIEHHGREKGTVFYPMHLVQWVQW